MNRTHLRDYVIGALLGLLLWLAFGPGSCYAAPADVRVGGTLLDAKRTTFAALGALELRGYEVDRRALRVRVSATACDGADGCAEINPYTGVRTVWWSRRLARRSVVIAFSKRTPTCSAWDLAIHELLHQAITLRLRERMWDGYWRTARDGQTSGEHETEHLVIYQRAELYTGQAERNGRCVEMAAGD